MSRLRKKIEQDHKNPKIIKTVYGAGYIFTLEVTWQ
jgi:DNA-binding response OmpR family regulator